MIGLVIVALLPALRNGVIRVRSGTRIRCTHPQTTWNSVAVRSCIDARFPKWPKPERRGPHTAAAEW